MSQIRITALNDRKAVGHGGDKACVQISTTKEALVRHSISNNDLIKIIVFLYLFFALDSYFDKFYCENSLWYFMVDIYPNKWVLSGVCVFFIRSLCFFLIRSLCVFRSQRPLHCIIKAWAFETKVTRRRQFKLFLMFWIHHFWKRLHCLIYFYVEDKKSVVF